MVFGTLTEIPSDDAPDGAEATDNAHRKDRVEAGETAESEPDTVPEQKQRTGRSRRRTAAGSTTDTDELDQTTSDDAAVETQSTTDAVSQALDELSQSRPKKTSRSRQRRVSEALDDLASAIAAEVAEVKTASEAEPTSRDEAKETEVEPSEDEADESGRRRRRRRGGRRHNKNKGEAETTDDSDRGDQPAQTGEAIEDGDGDGESGRRRRRRRRRGEEATEAEDDPAEVVVKVRSRRAASPGTGEVTGTEGSTRLEAKRQRSREGRAASRRRAPILSEAEFLARRESVARTMVIRQQAELSQIAVLEDDILVELYVDRTEATSLIGNVYLGRVQNVLPSMEAAFVDIGRGRNAILFAGEVDWETLGAAGENRKVEEVFTSGQIILVQVTKDPVGAKGARLTSHVSIPGRYVVYAPGGHLSGISRKLADRERSRLKTILDDLVDNQASVIIRTAAEGATTDELIHDINRLKAQWEVIEKKAAKGSAPQLLYSEPDLTMRIVRDLFTEDFKELVVDGNGGLTDAYETVEAYIQHVAPNLADRVKHWNKEPQDPGDENQGDLFAKYRIDEQIAKALDRKVHLPSGGTLIIDRTEAMTVIDVNTGKFTGSGGTLEATVTSNNLEAAEEIVRQL
ncbi:MAG: Rne/Rng family ribonuclease, partial [Micrococcales bacterium]|nr:Rne/Rng family ribonuclease [Micrococcales bacterium]